MDATYLLLLFSSVGATTVMQDVVNLTCTQETWHVTVDTHKLASIYPNSVPENIYLSNLFCPGVRQGDHLIFNTSFDDCNTQLKTKNMSLKYSNYLIEYDVDLQTHFVTGAKWRYDLGCDFLQNATDSTSLVPSNNNTATAHKSGSMDGHEAAITFYSDSLYENETRGNPLEVSIGTRIYVQVGMVGSADAKLLVDNCFVSEKIRPEAATSLPLIQNRCEANHFTHIIGHTDDFTRFYFDAFDVPHHHDSVYVTCDVSFCSLFDFSPECQNICERSNL
ncbi:CUB and zona pellucida-like domain-containing protein 1 [Haliotis rubra]|uniref:CUB and zona pellucida-like domain-containing protein 1 n=1 Tax=Haliotis rubra TaxID=36100 RepID=UPI001EE559EC|nr:CUB and zona pellucida-like domain-containing protein 1 [Haliotis rubra]